MNKNNTFLNSKTCLIINNYKFDRLLIEEVLEPTGIKIIYTSPDDVANLAPLKNIDIAIIDMGETSSTQLDELLEKIIQKYNCPVIGLTDYSCLSSTHAKITTILPKIEIVPNLVDTIIHCIET